MRPLRISLCVIAAVTGFFAVISGAEAGEKIKQAIALIYPVPGEKVTGELHIMPIEEGLKVTGSFSGLAPGSHGFHVHRYGNCTAPNEDSVGPHFMPMMEGKGFHGDLPNVEADKDGTAEYEAVVKNLSFTGENSIIGRGLVIHASTDEKIGCGVIGIAR